MSLELVSQIFAGLALIFALLAFGWRLRVFNSLNRPADLAQPKGRPLAGIMYAYTLGMAPWAKESTRRHWVAYLRGVGFHLGIFLGLGILVCSPWIPSLPAPIKLALAVGSGMGALLGLAGFGARLVERNLKALSTPDDYAAVLLTSLFLACTALWLAIPAARPVYYLLSGIMLVYAPYSKIRHCIYYAYSRLFYGRTVGSRAVLPHSQQHAQHPAAGRGVR